MLVSHSTAVDAIAIARWAGVAIGCNWAVSALRVRRQELPGAEGSYLPISVIRTLLCERPMLGLPAPSVAFDTLSHLVWASRL